MRTRPSIGTGEDCGRKKTDPPRKLPLGVTFFGSVLAMDDERGSVLVGRGSWSESYTPIQWGITSETVFRSFWSPPEADRSTRVPVPLGLDERVGLKKMLT